MEKYGLIMNNDRFVLRFCKRWLHRKVGRIWKDENSVSTTRTVSQDLLKVAGESNRKKLTPNYGKVQLNYAKKRNYQNEKLDKLKIKFAIEGEILFGISPVTMAIDARRRNLKKIFISVEAINFRNERLLDIENQVQSLGIQILRVPTKTLDQLSEGRPHQGVCMDVHPLQTEKLLNSSDDKLCENESKLWILLDRVQDPMNFGAILRSSYYFGVNKVLVTRSCCSLTPVVSKASSGAMELLRIYQIDDEAQFLQKKLAHSWSIVGTASRDAADGNHSIQLKLKNLKEMNWTNNTLLILGSEGNGISESILNFCQSFIYISCNGEVHPSLQSLNVSVATGIILQSYCCSKDQKR